MKILLFADKLPPQIGGMETHAHYFVRYFSSRYDLSIVSKYNGCDCIVDNKYVFQRHIILLDYLDEFRDYDGVIFFNSGRWIEEMEAIKKVLPNFSVFYRTGGNEIIKAPLSLPEPIYEKRVAYWVSVINSCVDYLITNSFFTDRRLVNIGIKPEILFHIAGGVSVPDIDDAVSETENTRHMYGIGTNEKLIVSCARFVPYKRPSFLIEALGAIKMEYKVIFAGDGPLLKSIKEQAINNNVPASFLGRISQEESLRLIACADCYVQASTDLLVEVEGGSYIHTEGMGRSLLEAVSCGVPVVVTNCGAVGEYINKDNGYIVESVEAMKEAVEEILCTGRKTNESELYKNKYSFNYIFENYEKKWKKDFDNNR